MSVNQFTSLLNNIEFHVKKFVKNQQKQEYQSYEIIKSNTIIQDKKVTEYKINKISKEKYEPKTRSQSPERNLKNPSQIIHQLNTQDNLKMKQNTNLKDQRDNLMIIEELNMHNFEHFYKSTPKKLSELEKILNSIRNDFFQVPENLMIENKDDTKIFKFYLYNKHLSVGNQVHIFQLNQSYDDKIILFKKYFISFLIHHKYICERFLLNIKNNLCYFRTNNNFQDKFSLQLNNLQNHGVGKSFKIFEYSEKDQNNQRIQLNIEDLKIKSYVCVFSEILEKYEDYFSINRTESIKHACQYLGNFQNTIMLHPQIYQYFELDEIKSQTMFKLISKIHSKYQFAMNFENISSENQFEHLFKYKNLIQSEQFFKNQYYDSLNKIQNVQLQDNSTISLKCQIEIPTLELYSLCYKINSTLKNPQDLRHIQSTQKVSDQIQQLNQISPHCIEQMDQNAILRMRSEVTIDEGLEIITIQGLQEEAEQLLHLPVHKYNLIQGYKVLIKHFYNLIQWKFINQIEIESIIKFSEFNFLTKKKSLNE